MWSHMQVVYNFIGIIGGGAVFFLTGLIASVCVFKRKIKKGNS